MKLCIPTKGNEGMKAEVNLHFGSALYFTVVGTEANEIEIIDNSDKHHAHGMCQPMNCLTGKDIDEHGLYRIGERVFNLQRAILSREGHKGRQNDTLQESNYEIPLEPNPSNYGCMIPGKDEEIDSLEGAVVDREQFEKMKDEYYDIRGWDVATGLQKKKGLEDLELKDVAEIMDKEGLLS